jgi:hypothetical protein
MKLTAGTTMSRLQGGFLGGFLMATIAGSASCSSTHATVLADDGGADAAAEDECGRLAGGGYVWPNACSKANSDPWIAQHHDQIVEERPVVLLIDFANSFTTYDGVVASPGYDLDAVVRPIVEKHVDAFKIASRYRGYDDAAAVSFKNYSLLKVVDARDDSGAKNSALLPVNASGTTVDYGQFTTQPWTDRIGVADPRDPGTHLSICSLFERGIINEVWGMVAEPAVAAFDGTAETKQAYDGDNIPIAGQLVNVSHGQNITGAVPCKVSVRFFGLDPAVGPGCQLHVALHALEAYVTSGALPAFGKVAATFFNFDYRTRFGTDFDSFYDVCPIGPSMVYSTSVCIAWQPPFPSTSAASGPFAGEPFDFSPLTAGCGNAHFPANAITHYSGLDPAYDQVPDSADPQLEAMSSCENYGLHNGSGGADALTPYSNALAALKYRDALGADVSMLATGCSGSQASYILGSMPGLNNHATALDGTPMKNWWVYEYY